MASEAAMPAFGARAVRFVVAAVAFVALTSCRSGIGSTCDGANDCEKGLFCQNYLSGSSGTCEVPECHRPSASCTQRCASSLNFSLFYRFAPCRVTPEKAAGRYGDCLAWCRELAEWKQEARARLRGKVP